TPRACRGLAVTSLASSSTGGRSDREPLTEPSASRPPHCSTHGSLRDEPQTSSLRETLLGANAIPSRPSTDGGTDAAGPRADRLFLFDLEAADLARVRHVRAAAQLLRHAADRVDRDFVAVAIVEQADGPGLLRLFVRHHLRGDVDARIDGVLHQLLHGG